MEKFNLVRAYSEHIPTWIGPQSPLCDGITHPTDSTYPHGTTNVPDVQDQPDDNHQGEEDVE